MLKEQSLDNSLKQTWMVYRKMVELSLATPTSKNIHDTRLAIQQLEAILSFSNQIDPHHLTDKLIYSIKNTRKHLGGLRDIQIESDAFAQQETSVGLEKFAIFFEKHKVKEMLKAQRCLAEVPLKKERMAMNKIVNRLRLVQKEKNKNEIQHSLDKNMQSSYEDLAEKLKSKSTIKLRDLHKCRVWARTLKNQGQFMESIFGFTPAHLKKIEVATDAIGKIQDESAFMHRIDDYMDKKNQKVNPMVKKMRRNVSLNQKEHFKKELKHLSQAKW